MSVASHQRHHRVVSPWLTELFSLVKLLSSVSTSTLPEQLCPTDNRVYRDWVSARVESQDKRPARAITRDTEDLNWRVDKCNRVATLSASSGVSGAKVAGDEVRVYNCQQPQWAVSGGATAGDGEMLIWKMERIDKTFWAQLHPVLQTQTLLRAGR